MRFNSRVVHSSPERSECLVAVDAEVINPATGQRQTTNEFHLTFKIPKDPTKPLAKVTLGT